MTLFAPRSTSMIPLFPQNEDGWRVMEVAMGHVIKLLSREQYIAALKILDVVPGTFHASGPSSSPVLVLGDTQYQALIRAGVITANGKEGVARGKKAIAKKTKP